VIAVLAAQSPFSLPRKARTSNYTRKELEPWVQHIRKQAATGKKVFAYFNNDLNVRAPNNAKVLMEMCRWSSVDCNSGDWKSTKLAGLYTYHPEILKG
jgi:uncharacterized protein YecE (DUF72 family)